jgi:hypothetical protein
MCLQRYAADWRKQSFHPTGTWPRQTHCTRWRKEYDVHCNPSSSPGDWGAHFTAGPLKPTHHPGRWSILLGSKTGVTRRPLRLCKVAARSLPGLSNLLSRRTGPTKAHCIAMFRWNLQTLIYVSVSASRYHGNPSVATYRYMSRETSPHTLHSGSWYVYPRSWPLRNCEWRRANSTCSSVTLQVQTPVWASHSNTWITGTVCFLLPWRNNAVMSRFRHTSLLTVCHTGSSRRRRNTALVALTAYRLSAARQRAVWSNSKGRNCVAASPTETSGTCYTIACVRFILMPGKDEAPGSPFCP